MSVLLEVKGLSKTFVSRFEGTQGEKEIRALDRVDLSVHSGEHLSIVGGSGCGKTTLAKVIMGLINPDAGQMFFHGERMGRDSKRLRDFRRKVRMVFQDPFASLDPRLTVRSILEEAVCLEGRMEKAAREARMRAKLLAVDLPDNILARYPHEFSGGERQRIAIARALMTDPEILVLDEAVSSIDVIAQKMILELLASLQVKMSVTFIFISHNLRVVRKISHKIAVMSQGRIVEYGTVGDICDRPGHAYTRQLLKAALEYRCAAVGDVAVSRSGKLVDIGLGHCVLAEDI